jgi:Domain of unknown function (DUF4351)
MRVFYLNNICCFLANNKLCLNGSIESLKLLTIRMLTRKLGTLAPNSIDLISNLDLETIESLGDALLDFNTTADLTAWLDKSLRGIQ